MSIYLAGPWFTVRQEIVLEAVKKTLIYCELEFYSPKDEMPFSKGGEFSPEKIYQSNIDTIMNSDLVVVITDGKDVGTIFEAGFATAIGIPIVYVWAEPIDGAKFNIMLAQSGEACYLGLSDFKTAMLYYSKYKHILKSEYIGELE